jgi:hypothetical protein
LLNLEAVYKTTANPSLLIDNTSFNRKVPVEVVIGIKGDLMSPEPDFNIEFPTVSNVLKSEIQTKLYDKEVRQTQALYLLSTGSFLSAEGINQNDISGSLFETAAGLLGDLIQSDNDKFEVGINVVGADRRLGRETDGRFEASVSSKINDRITFNGKLGVPFGGISQTAFVGNVELLWRLDQEGDLNARIFNKENDINFIGQGIGYTQGIGISYQVDFDTFRELIQKMFKKNRVIQSIPSEYLNQDFDLSPYLINNSASYNAVRIKVHGAYWPSQFNPVTPAQSRLIKEWQVGVWYNDNTGLYAVEGGGIQSSFNTDATNFGIGAFNSGKAFISGTGTSSLVLRLQQRTSPAADSATYFNYLIEVMRW